MNRTQSVKITRPYTQQDFITRTEKICNENAQREAFRFMRDDGSRDSITFAQVLSAVKNNTQQILRSGITAGERIAVITPLMPAAVITGVTLAYAGVTAVLIDPTLPAEEINRLLVSSDVRGIFTVSKIYEGLPSELTAKLPVFDLESDITNLSRFASSAEEVLLPETVDKHPDVAAILFSSGTTASMKGIMMTFHSVMRSRDLFADISGMNTKTSYLIVFPYNHISGYSSSMMYFLTGCSMGMIENVNASKLADGLQEYNPYHFGMVPKVFDIMADKIRAAIHEKGAAVEAVINGLIRFSGFVRKKTGIRLGKHLLGIVYKKALGKNICGLAILGTPCRKETAELFLNMGIEWANLYATTETSAPVCCTGIHDLYPENSVGYIHQYEDDIQIRINNPDNNGIGEVYVKSGLMMKGYFRDEELTAEAFDGGWFKTGDLGYLDKNDNLYICGRLKETVVLHNGKKVSAVDIDAFYQQVCGDVTVASCAVPNDEGYDELHLFIESASHDAKKLDEIRNRILEKSSQSGSLYKLSGVHFTDKIPTTSVGKVKRYLLKQQINIADNKPLEITANKSNSIDETITAILAQYAKQFSGEITESTDIKNDLGFDSLTMFEIATEIEHRLHVDVSSSLGNINTVGQLIAAVKSPETATNTINMADFPAPKTEKSLRRLRKWIKTFRRLYRFEVSGLENIPQDENYIISSNHINNLDPIWLLAALGDKIEHEKVGCLAAVHLFEKKSTRKLFDMMGAIPVDRSGNTVPAMNRCRECLENGMTLIIFPEGARTRDGKLLPFKNGTAMLSIESGRPIIPARIDGGFEIFPRHKKLPRLFYFGKMSKYTIGITFGKPIYPDNRSESEITEVLKSTIENI